MSLDPSILHALLSPDGAQRGAAEAAYEQAKAASPETVASGLLACLPVGAQPDGVRIMAAVLLRQFVDNKRPQWAAMSPQVRITHTCRPYLCHPHIPFNLSRHVDLTLFAGAHGNAHRPPSARLRGAAACDLSPHRALRRTGCRERGVARAAANSVWHHRPRRGPCPDGAVCA